jgi:uncharacterized repeat protein (TIGR01451 family)
MCLNINGEYRERKRYTLNAGETTTLSFREYRWNGDDDVEVCVDCIDTSCCTPDGSTKPDLIVSDKWEESVNEDVIVHFTVKNIGGGDAGASTACLEINGIYEGTVNVPALAAGESDVGEFAPEHCPPLTTITVTVCADNDDVVEESNEDNNCMTNDFTCPAKPDLVVIEKWEEPVDGQVIVHFIIENIGDGWADASYATLYINSVLVETQNVRVEELGPNGRFTSEFAAEDCTPGTTIIVTVCADDTKVVDESDEGNNCMTNYFTCPIQPQPDLVVENKWEESVDEQVIVHFEIHNSGTANAVASQATLYIDGVKLQNVEVEEVGPTGTFTGEFAAEDCTPGTTITVKVCADDTNVVDESDEGNNCMTNDFTCPVPEKPDLVVTETSEEYVDGQVIVHFEIHNSGTANAGACDATLYINRVLVATQNVGVLGLGLDGTFNGAFAPMLCTPGTTNTVMVCVDDANVIDESNENNNCMTNSFTCPIQPQPDLVVENKWEESVDGQVIVHFSIENIGDAKAVASQATLYIDDVKLQNVEVEEVGPSGTFTGAFATEDCTPGTTITVKVCADDTNVVEESNETNNCMTNSFTCPVPEKPDLVVIEMWEEPVKADGHVIVHFIIENIGDADAGESYATLYIDDMLVEEQNVWVPALGLSGRFTSEFALELCHLADNITVMVCADDTHVVDESNETNNCRTNYFICPSQGPDLVITKTVTQQIVDCDTCEYRVDYTVTNIGNEVACGECVGGQSQVALLVDGVLLARLNCRRLGPGASVDGTFGWRNCPCADDFNVTVCADYFNVVDEGNESNNCEINPLHCGLGDIDVDKTVWDGAWVNELFGAVRGDIVEFRGVVENTGCCCFLDSVMVTDVLPASLEYVNATPTPNTITYNADGTTTIAWPESTLLRCEINEYRINATVIVDCGLDEENTMTAIANATCTDTVVDDSDSAWVDIPTRAGVTIDKTVWNGAAWVDSITVRDGTRLRFRCIVRNTGVCQDLTFVTVWDTLEWYALLRRGLDYTGSLGPQPPYGPQTPVVSEGAGFTKVEWDLPWYVVQLSPGEELEFFVYASAHTRWPTTYWNRQEVTALSIDQLTGASVWVYDIDRVAVRVI